MPELTILPEDIQSQITREIEKASQEIDGYISQSINERRIEPKHSVGDIRDIRMKALVCYKEIKEHIYKAILDSLIRDEGIADLYKMRDFQRKIMAAEKRNLMFEAAAVFISMAVGMAAIRFCLLAVNMSDKAAFIWAFCITVVTAAIFGRRLLFSYNDHAGIEKSGRLVNSYKGKRRKLDGEYDLLKEKVRKSYLDEGSVPEDDDGFIYQVLNAIWRLDLQVYKECCVFLKGMAEKEMKRVNEALKEYAPNKEEICRMEVSEEEKAVLDDLENIEDRSKREAAAEHLKAVGDEIGGIEQEKILNIRGAAIAAICFFLVTAAAFFVCSYR